MDLMHTVLAKMLDGTTRKIPVLASMLDGRPGEIISIDGKLFVWDEEWENGMRVIHEVAK